MLLSLLAPAWRVWNSFTSLYIDPGTPLLDRFMGTFPTYKPTAGIESGGVVLQKPRIYCKCKRGLRCFEALGQTVVGEGFPYVNSTFLLSLLIYAQVYSLT
jgi:hypothetical protein